MVDIFQDTNLSYATTWDKGKDEKKVLAAMIDQFGQKKVAQYLETCESDLVRLKIDHILQLSGKGKSMKWA